MGSPSKKETRKEINKLRKKLNMKPLKEVDKDYEDYVKESKNRKKIKR